MDHKPFWIADINGAIVLILSDGETFAFESVAN